MQTGKTFQVPEQFVAMRNVDVARGENVVLHGLELNIATGEHVAILGPNGCGKSTLIKTITCECYPVVRPGMQSLIYGRDRWEVQELRKHLGVVAAELPGERTPRTRGLDAVVSGFFASSTIWPNLEVTDAMRESAVEALDLLEARHLRDRWVGQMSAGETRRVMIARALVHKPEMLLLDEPSNALDLASQRELREILARLSAANGNRDGDPSSGRHPAGDRSRHHDARRTHRRRRAQGDAAPSGKTFTALRRGPGADGTERILAFVVICLCFSFCHSRRESALPIAALPKRLEADSLRE